MVIIISIFIIFKQLYKRYQQNWITTFSKANHSTGQVTEQQGNTPPLTELSIATLIMMITDDIDNTASDDDNSNNKSSGGANIRK